jgi:hypothetical protein
MGIFFDYRKKIGMRQKKRLTVEVIVVINSVPIDAAEFSESNGGEKKEVWSKKTS